MVTLPMGNFRTFTYNFYLAAIPADVQGCGFILTAGSGYAHAGMQAKHSL